MTVRAGGVEDCRACLRPTRPQGSGASDFPGTTLRMAKGLCSRCYALDRRGVDPFAVPLPQAKPEAAQPAGENRAWLKIGTPVQLVRWVRTADGDVARLVEGEYRGCTPQVWRVSVLGKVGEYAREAWEVTTP